MTDAITREVPLGIQSNVEDMIIRVVASSDVSGLAALLSEMQRHYRRPVTDEQAMRAATMACQPTGSVFDPRVLVATLNTEIVGSLILNVTFPAFELTRALYIRDLYVAYSARRRGVGQALVKAAGQLTYAAGFSALDWTTETGNVGARQMYESCGARVLSRTYYRLASEDMLAEDERHGTATSPGDPVKSRPQGECRLPPAQARRSD